MFPLPCARFPKLFLGILAACRAQLCWKWAQGIVGGVHLPPPFPHSQAHSSQPAVFPQTQPGAAPGFAMLGAKPRKRRAPSLCAHCPTFTPWCLTVPFPTLTSHLLCLHVPQEQVLNCLAIC